MNLDLCGKFSIFEKGLQKLTIYFRELYLDADDREDFGNHVQEFQGLDEITGETVLMAEEGCRIEQVHTQTADGFASQVKLKLRKQRGCQRDDIPGYRNTTIRFVFNK